MVYVISDLHGYPLGRLKALLEQAEFGADDFLYVLGDVIDRGSDGISLLRWLMLQPNAELILGNHEDMMLKNELLLDEVCDESADALTTAQLSAFSHWFANGGTETLRGLKLLRPQERRYVFEYLHDAPLYDFVEVDGRAFLLTHSGLGNFSPEKEISEYSKHDLVWHRPSLIERYFDGITVVFGHTPTVNYGKQYEGVPIVTDTWINIDVGCGWGYPPLLLRLDDMKEFYPAETKRDQSE